MSIKVIVSLEVKDYENFSNLFNSEGPVTARKEAGIVAEAHKNLDSPTNAVVIGTATSKEDFLTFFNQQHKRNVCKMQGWFKNLQ